MAVLLTDPAESALAMHLSPVRWTAGDVARATLLVVAMIAVSVGALALGLRLAGAGGERINDIRVAGVPFALVLLGVQAAVFVFAAWWYSVRKYGAGRRALGLVAPRTRRPYALAVAGWLAALAATLIWQEVVSFLGWSSLELTQDAATEVLGLGGGLWLSILVIGVWGPLTEEVFFRGFALPGLQRRFGVAGALVLSSALFALFHIAPQLYVPIFIFGIVLGWLYLKTGSILPCIVAHAMQNTLALIVVYAS